MRRGDNRSIAGRALPDSVVVGGGHAPHAVWQRLKTFGICRVVAITISAGGVVFSADDAKLLAYMTQLIPCCSKVRVL